MEEKSFLQKSTVKHKSKIREYYCKKKRWKRLYPLTIHSTLKGERRDEKEKNLAQISRKGSYFGKLANLKEICIEQN